MKKYKGHVIIKTCQFYWTLGRCFATLKLAKAQIDLL
jgi:hypothetical protein